LYRADAPASPEADRTAIVVVMRDAASFEELLARACANHLGGAPALSNLQTVTGGASRQTVSFDAAIAGQELPLILRRDPPRSSPAATANDQRGMAADRNTEFLVIKAMYEAGVRAPQPLFALEPADGLGQGFVMRRMPGTAIARKLLRDAEYAVARRRMVDQVGETLARIHAVDPARLPPLPTVGAADHISMLRKTLDAIGQPSPVFELALAWLERRLPKDAPVRPLHGDFRTGNLLADRDGLTAALDWEAPHHGDPLEDLGWFCVKSWRFGEIDKPAGGFGSREALWAAYARAGGSPVDPARAHYWEVFGTVRWGIICLIQADKHLSGAQRSMELCTIGRRAAETEYDLIELFRAA
jgi:aminoglycoside phosphotransferase (APT) family kinase protein